MRIRTRLLSACLAIVLPPQNAAAATVRLVADEWCPYNCEPGSALPGYMVEVAQRVFAAAGHEVRYKRLPWSRAVIETRRGDHDAVIGAARDGQAKDFIFPEVALGEAADAFLVRSGDAWRYRGVESLNDISIGVMLNYSYDPQVDAYILAHKGNRARVQIEAGDGALSVNLRKLLDGRIGVLIENRAVLEYQINTRGLAGKVEMAGFTNVSAAYVAFSPAKPTSTEYAKLLSDGVVALRRSGELAKILARYGLHDWAK